jgi:hypothetical protein
MSAIAVAHHVGLFNRPWWREAANVIVHGCVTAKAPIRDAGHTSKRLINPMYPSAVGLIVRRSTMFVRKIITALVLVAIATTVATTSAFANAPGGAYIQCNGGPSSPVRCTPDSW